MGSLTYAGRRTITGEAAASRRSFTKLKVGVAGRSRTFCLSWIKIETVISKRALIVSTLGTWVIACALYGYYYVVSILALPEPYDAYARNWQFQLLMFSIFRLPMLLLVLPLIIYLELIAFEVLNGPNVQQ